MKTSDKPTEQTQKSSKSSGSSDPPKSSKVEKTKGKEINLTLLDPDSSSPIKEKKKKRKSDKETVNDKKVDKKVVEKSSSDSENQSPETQNEPSPIEPKAKEKSKKSKESTKTTTTTKEKKKDLPEKVKSGDRVKKEKTTRGREDDDGSDSPSVAIKRTKSRTVGNSEREGDDKGKKRPKKQSRQVVDSSTEEEDEEEEVRVKSRKQRAVDDREEDEKVKLKRTKTKGSTPPPDPTNTKDARRAKDKQSPRREQEVVDSLEDQSSGDIDDGTADEPREPRRRTTERKVSNGTRTVEGAGLREPRYRDRNDAGVDAGQTRLRSRSRRVDDRYQESDQSDGLYQDPRGSTARPSRRAVESRRRRDLYNEDQEDLLPPPDTAAPRRREGSAAKPPMSRSNLVDKQPSDTSPGDDSYRRPVEAGVEELRLPPIAENKGVNSSGHGRSRHPSDDANKGEDSKVSPLGRDSGGKENSSEVPKSDKHDLKDAAPQVAESREKLPKTSRAPRKHTPRLLASSSSSDSDTVAPRPTNKGASGGIALTAGNIGHQNNPSPGTRPPATSGTKITHVGSMEETTPRQQSSNSDVTHLPTSTPHVPEIVPGPLASKTPSPKNHASGTATKDGPPPPAPLKDKAPTVVKSSATLKAQPPTDTAACEHIKLVHHRTWTLTFMFTSRAAYGLRGSQYQASQDNQRETFRTV